MRKKIRLINTAVLPNSAVFNSTFHTNVKLFLVTVFLMKTLKQAQSFVCATGHKQVTEYGCDKLVSCASICNFFPPLCTNTFNVSMNYKNYYSLLYNSFFVIQQVFVQPSNYFKPLVTHTNVVITWRNPLLNKTIVCFPSL